MKWSDEELKAADVSHLEKPGSEKHRAKWDRRNKKKKKRGKK